MDISVIICTYNRFKSLIDTLDSLLMQQINYDLNFEIIVVDNNSHDITKEIIDSYLSKFNGRLRYVVENNRGLSYARNTGIRESGGKIIAFLDDDIIADKRWLSNIAQCFKDYNCDAVGGRILPLYNDSTPQWVKDNLDILCGPIVNHDYGDVEHSYEKGKMKPLVGANMAFQKTCFQELGYFKTDLGQGKGLLGDDTEIFFRLKESGKKIMYCGKAVVLHKVEKGRTNLCYIAKWCIAYGRYRKTREGKKGETDSICTVLGFPRYLIRQIFNDGICLIHSSFMSREFIENWKSIFIKIGTGLEHHKIHKCRKLAS